MGCVPNSLTAAKCLNMATPIFGGHGSGKTAVSPVQNGHILGVVIKFKVFNSIFCILLGG